MRLSINSLETRLKVGLRSFDEMNFFRSEKTIKVITWITAIIFAIQTIATARG